MGWWYKHSNLWSRLCLSPHCLSYGEGGVGVNKQLQPPARDCRMLPEPQSTPPTHSTIPVCTTIRCWLRTHTSHTHAHTLDVSTSSVCPCHITHRLSEQCCPAPPTLCRASALPSNCLVQPILASSRNMREQSWWRWALECGGTCTSLYACLCRWCGGPSAHHPTVYVSSPPVPPSPLPLLLPLPLPCPSPQCELNSRIPYTQFSTIIKKQKEVCMHSESFTSCVCTASQHTVMASHCP